MGDLRVRLAAGGFLPQAFKWKGRSYRILAVHSVKTCGAERRYRVASSEGYFELGLDVRSGAWCIRRHPNWLSRILYRWQHGARYPLPAWRRRRPLPARASRGGRASGALSAGRMEPAPVANRL